MNTLQKMHAAGFSFALIGDAIGMSKNSCISKAGRLKLSKRRTSERQPRKQRPSRAKAINRPVLRIVRAGYGNGLRVASSVMLSEMPVFACIDAAPLNKTLLELGANDCKYIAGDPREGALYCGHPVSQRSYCADHFARCYVEPLKRWGAPSSPGYQAPASGAPNHLESVA
ncbi:hypothetical protein IVB47_25120 [Bradyrhizobium sp. 62]|nr:hypothetical protein [Bradyrhizobium sp. 62]